MRRILILSSAAIALSGCSMFNNSPFSNAGDQQYQSNQYQNSYGQDNCGVSRNVNHCASGNSYSVANSDDQYGQHTQHGQYSNHDYAAPQQPSTHAYGSQVQNHSSQNYSGQDYSAQNYASQNNTGHNYSGQNYSGQNGQAYSHGQTPQLRGAYNSNRRQAYKYGTLGAVAYDLGSDIYGLQGRVGYQSANYWGAEVEGSFGIASEEDTFGTDEINAGVDYSVAAFARGVVPLGNSFNVFGRAGYHVTGIDDFFTDASGAIDASDTTDGFAYGAGAEYAFTSRDSLRLDYTRYDLGSNEIDSLALAYARKF